MLLPFGMTSHRFFNLPIELNEEGICFLKICDKFCLQDVDVVMWDEASMMLRKDLETIDRTLCNIMNNRRKNIYPWRRFLTRAASCEVSQ